MDSRSGTVEAEPAGARPPGARSRTPTQERSRKRFELVLATAARFLEVANIEDISVRDLALEADMPEASVHYLFPTMAAVQAELVRKYDRELSSLICAHHDRMSAMPWNAWPEWIRASAAECMRYYNASRPASEVLLGPTLNRGVRSVMQEGNKAIGESTYRWWSTLFDLPDGRGLERMLSRNCDLMKMFWSRSYLTRGFLDQEAFEHSMRCSIGYLRSVLPEALPRAGEMAAAARRA